MSCHPRKRFRPRLLPWAAALALPAILSAQSFVLTEFPLPSINSTPDQIVAGPDGALWFTEYERNRIGRITTAGVITEFPIPTPNSQPYGITVGPDGAIWFTEFAGRKVGRITTAGAITEFPVPLTSNGPIGITTGPDGALWVINTGKLVRMTTAGVVTESDGDVGWGIVTGPDGALWFTEYANHMIGRNAGGVYTQFPIPTPFSKPNGIAVGPDGAIWFTEYSANKIGRITTAGVVTEFAIPTPNSVPYAIAVGPDGALWFTESEADKIGRITTSGVISEYEIPTVHSGPLGIVTGPDGSLWFTEGGTSKIGRLTVNAAGCSFGLSASGASFGTAAAGGSVNVTAGANCAWSASSQESWVIVTAGATGSGNGTVTYSVLPNNASGSRTAVLTIAGLTYRVTQAGLGCLLSVTPGSASFGVNGGSDSFHVDHTSADCAWTASKDVPWITITGGSAGTGDGVVDFTVAPNQSSAVARTGTVTVVTPGTQATVTVTQAGTTCTYSLPQSSQSFPAAGGSGAVQVIAQGGCSWTAVVNVPWIAIVGPGSGSGNGSANYTVAANISAAARSGAIIVGGRVYTIRQAGNTATTACSASVSSVPLVAIEGRTEVLGDLVLNCTGLTGSLSTDVSLTLNTNVSNALSSASATDAALTVNGGSPQPGQLSGYNTLRWAGVPIVPSGGAATLRISGVRGDASLLAATAGLAPAAITGLVSLSGAVAIPVSGAQQPLANASPAMAFQKQAASPGAQSFLPLVFQENGVAGFRAGSSGGTATRLRVVLSSVPSTVQVYAPVFPSEGASRAQLFSADASGAGGSAVTGATMAGALYQQLTVTGGTATATWVLLSADTSQIDVLTFPLLVTNGSPADLSQIQATGSLAPVSTVSAAAAAVGFPYSVSLSNPLTGTPPFVWAVTGGALPGGLLLNASTGVVSGVVGSAGTFAFSVTVTDSLGQSKSQSFTITTAPVPRTRDFAAPQKFVNLRITTSVQTGTSALQPKSSSRGAVAVGSNVTYVSQLINDTADPAQTATNVIVRDNLPSAVTTVSCAASGGAVCSVTGNQLLVNVGTLGPGQTVTVTAVAAVNAVPDGTVIENPVSVSADQVNVDLLAGTASSSFVVLNGLVSVGGTPAFGSGATQDFTFQFNHPSGYQNLGVVNVLVNNFLDGRNACYLAYAVPSSTLFLVNDAGQAGGPYAGSAALGSAGVLQNSQCGVTLVSALGAGNTLTLVLKIAFNPVFGGNRIVYVAARDQGTGNTDWQALGVWRAPFTPPGSITVTGISPARGEAPAGTSRQFAFTLTDSQGAGDFGVVNVLVNRFLDGRQACYLAYVASTNTLYLVNDAGDAGGPYAGGMVLNGGSGGIGNSQCAVSGSGSTVAYQPNTLTVTLNITFKGAFTGNRVVYVAGRDLAGGNNTDWQAAGTWTIQ